MTHDSNIHLHHHPQQEVLADRLISTLQQEGAGNIFHQSCVLVRNQGMATWLRQKMASASGVAMQVDFPQPNRFLRSVIDTESSQVDDFTWKIYQKLPKLTHRPEFRIIRDYLNSGVNETEKSLKRFQLSKEVAALFDKYLLYRPQWIHAWSRGQQAKTFSVHENWQSSLWRAIQDHDIQHWSQTLLTCDALPEDLTLPPAAHVFGISNFAPIYVRFLQLLSQRIPVHIYWMNPVAADEGYWEDAPTQRQWLLAKAFEDNMTLLDGNSLLASFGRMGREFIHTIYGGEVGNVEVNNYQVDSPLREPTTTLESVQHAIYQRSSIDDSADYDNSISIRSCHTPLRELETLRDYLLKLSEDKPLDTGEVLVLCPDIETYAPAIEAVFSSIPKDAPDFLPFRISDRSSLLEDPAVNAIIDLFSLHRSRFTNHEALNLLATPPISNSMGLDEAALELITEWVKRSGIRWGADESHVASLTPNCPESPWTWKAGIERLLLGYAMPSSPHEVKLWRDLLPYSDIEGSCTQVLGGLCSFINWCDDIRQSLKTAKSLKEWVESLRSWIDSGFDKSAATQQQLQGVFEVLDEFMTSAEDFSDRIPAEVFQQHLREKLSDPSTPYGFLSGSITFCEMKPMRAIPAKVICLLGMNHDAFPRSTAEIQFDLTRNQRIAGDRSSRDDDCYFFLEALLSAREKLYLSYIGTSIKDGEARPPSTALQTLIDSTPGLNECLEREQLHPFDPSYFNATKPVSYSSDLCEAASILQQRNNQPSLLSLPELTPILRDEISISELTQALTRSATYYLDSTLNTKSSFRSSTAPDTEVVELDGLTAWKIRTELLTRRQIDDTTIKAWQQSGLLPIGELGAVQLNKAAGELQEALEQLPQVEQRDLRLEIHGVTIYGSVDTDQDGNILLLSASEKPKAEHLAQAWLHHCLLQLATESPTHSRIFTTKKGVKEHILTPCHEAEKVISWVLKLFKQLQHRPVFFFPETMWTYVTAKPRGKYDDPQLLLDHKLSAAYTAWTNSYNNQGEGLKEDNQCLFGQSDIFNDSFTDAINAFWNPLAANYNS